MSDSISIPKRSLWSAGIFVVLAPFTWVQMQYFVIPDAVSAFQLVSQPDPSIISIQHIRFIWAPIIGYLLVSVSLSIFLNIWQELQDGLVFSFGKGFFIGFVTTGIFTFIGTVLGLFGDHFINFLMGGLLSGIIVGMAFGFFYGLIRGIQREYFSDC